MAGNPARTSGYALGAPPPQPLPGSGTRIQTVRAQPPGGALMGYMQSQAVLWFEQLYRKLPPEGMFGATPSRPVRFTMGAFRVPKSMVLVVQDYAFDIYRFSGAAAGDYVPIEENRLSTQIGWDIQVDSDRPANLSFQIIPQVQSQSQPTFATIAPGVPAQQWQFDEVRALQNQGPAGPALSMMPQRRHRPGLMKLSNQYVARAGQVLQVTCSVINAVPIPIAFFEAGVTGLLITQSVFDAYQTAAAPVGDPFQAPIAGAT